MKQKDNYLLRYAAGANWLIKTDQQDADYIAPLMINEVGALIWKGIGDGCDLQELSALLQSRYHIEPEVALKDVKQFLTQLEKWDIITA